MQARHRIALFATLALAACGGSPTASDPVGPPAPTTGSLSVSVSGLPQGTAASVTVTGPANFSRAVTGSTTITGLAPGQYTVTADVVTGGASSYSPTPGSQLVSVQAGTAAASASVAYAAAPTSTLNLTVAGAYVVQAIQTPDRSVPLVRGRDAVLRVFVTANQANSAAPSVRVRAYQNGSLVQTLTIPAPGASVPLAMDESALANSWNVTLSGTLVQPGLSLLVDVDPTGSVAESSKADNTWPAGGSPQAMDVRSVVPFAIRFVPVIVQGSQAGNVSAANMNQFLVTLQKLWPVNGVSPDVRSQPYTSSAAVLQSDNGNSAWGTVLSEIYALRTADNSTKTYYGVVKTSYSSGVAGIGYVGAPAAVGWDRLPSGDGVLAHEIGHTWSQNHAPCGGAGNPDPNYPNANGQTGYWGLDVATNVLKAPTSTDIMGYCGSQWVSPYMFNRVFAYRMQTGAVTASATTVQSGLLVWGRVQGGQVVLEPAFELDAAPVLPQGGPWTLEGVDAAGASLFRYGFTPLAVADDPSGAAQFAFVLPRSAAWRDRLAGLRVAGPGGTALRASAAMQALPPGVAVAMAQPDPAPDAVAEAPGAVRVRWDATQYPMALVRDPATGAILSFARGGDALVAAQGGSLDVTFSDGVRSRAGRVAVR